jgi:DNA-binding transcriptional LysR family regulator
MFDERVIRGISVFVGVADSGSFSNAASVVGLSKSGISRSLIRLEDRLGFRLFDRTRRGMKLTAEGRLFYESVVPVLARLELLSTPSTKAPGSLKGKLRIGSESAFAWHFLVPRIPEFTTLHSNLLIDLILKDGIADIATEGYDLAIRWGMPEDPYLENQFLFDVRVVTCAGREYVESHGLPAHPTELPGKFNCVRLLDPTSGRPYDWVFLDGNGGEIRLLPECALTINDSAAVMAVLRNNVGITRALDFMVKDLITAGEVVEVLPEWNHRRRPAYAYWRAQAPVSPSLAAFLEFLKRFPEARVAPPEVGEHTNSWSTRRTAVQLNRGT